MAKNDFNRREHKKDRDWGYDITIALISAFFQVALMPIAAIIPASILSHRLKHPGNLKPIFTCIICDSNGFRLGDSFEAEAGNHFTPDSEAYLSQNRSFIFNSRDKEFYYFDSQLPQQYFKFVNYVGAIEAAEYIPALEELLIEKLIQSSKPLLLDEEKVFQPDYITWEDTVQNFLRSLQPANLQNVQVKGKLKPIDTTNTPFSLEGKPTDNKPTDCLSEAPGASRWCEDENSQHF